MVEHPTDLTKPESILTTEHILATRSGNADLRETYKHKILPTGQQRKLKDSVMPIGTGEVPVHLAPCKWCTAVLKLVATKSKEIQKKARVEIEELEKQMDGNAELKKMHEEIENKEKEMDALRHGAWKRARRLTDMETNGDSDKRERVEG